MEPAKRPKLQCFSFHIDSTSSDSKQTTNHIEQTADIFRLNDDCFDAILYRLSIDDLPALRETCVRIQNLVDIHFSRKYPEERCKIVRSLNGMIKIHKYGGFKEYLQNIWFHDRRQHDGGDLLMYYIYSQCNKRPRCIRFQNMFLVQEHGQLINAPLMTTEAIECINCGAYDIYKHIFMRCVQLKSLNVKHSRALSYEGVENWLKHRYPMLESLEIHLQISPIHEELKIFFELNPQIKRFIYNSRRLHGQSKMGYFMNAISENSSELDELSITIRSDDDFRNIFIQLLNITRRQQFKRLTVEFYSSKDVLIDNLNNLACLDKLHALHINSIELNDDLPSNFDLLVNLKELHLSNSSNYEHSSRILTEKMPNLELLVIRNSIYFTPSVVDFIQPYVECSVNLKKIVLAHDVTRRINQYFKDLNEKRQSLDDACIVHIWCYSSSTPNRTKLQPKIEGKILIQMHELIDDNEN